MSNPKDQDLDFSPIDDLSVDFSALDLNVVGSEDVLPDLNGEIVDTDPELADFGNEFADLPSDLPDLNAEIVDTDPELADFGNEFADLPSDLPDLNAEIVDTDPELADFGNEFADLPSDLPDLNAEIVDTDPELADIGNEFADLPSDLPGLNGEIVDTDPELASGAAFGASLAAEPVALEKTADDKDKKGKKSKKEKAPKVKKEKPPKTPKIKKEKPPKKPRDPNVPQRSFGELVALSAAGLLSLVFIAMNILTVFNHGLGVSTIMFLVLADMIAATMIAVPVIFVKYSNRVSVFEVSLGLAVLAVSLGTLLLLAEWYRYDFSVNKERTVSWIHRSIEDGRS